eukprot:8129577-Lingulodinium_polyedra.AAC.1
MEEGGKTEALAMGACKLTAEDVALWQRMYDHLKAHPTQLTELRAKAGQAPEPLSPEEVENLESLPVEDDVGGSLAKPPWLSMVCRMRDQLGPCGLRFREAGGLVTMVKVLFCKLQPME